MRLSRLANAKLPLCASRIRTIQHRTTYIKHDDYRKSGVRTILFRTRRLLRGKGDSASRRCARLGYCKSDWCSHALQFGFPATSFELDSLAATLPRVSSSKLDLRNSKLDEVVRAFGKVLGDGRDISVCRLIKAIRAHLDLMRSGGAALSLVAKDLESNLLKVEQLYRRHPNKCKTLASLLEFERDEMVIHRGNELEEDSGESIKVLLLRHISNTLLTP